MPPRMGPRMRYSWIPASAGMTDEETRRAPATGVSIPLPLFPTPYPLDREAALMPYGHLRRRAASAGAFAHVGVAEVEVGYYAVAFLEAEEAAHVLVVGDGAGAPDAREAQRVGRQLHVLDGGGAGGVVLQCLDLIAAGDGDHGDDDGRSEGLFALAADSAGHHLLVLSLGLGRESRGFGPGTRKLAPPSAGKDVEAPRLGDLVVRGVHGTLQNTLDEDPFHGVLLYAVYALARLYGTDHIQRLSQPISPTGSILSGSGTAGAVLFAYHAHIDTSDIGRSEMAKSKVTVVGAGNVGGTTAQRLAERNYADVVLVDIVEGLPQGKALDILQSGPILGFDSNVTGTNGYEDTAGSDVVVITSGSPRKPGMSRDDLLKTNQNIVSSVTEEVVKHSPDAILVMVANPLDAMCHVAMETSGFPRERVVGMAGILDTARYRTFIAQELGVSVRDVFALVLGGHGDTMVPLPSMATVGGVAITELLPEDRVEAIVDRTRNGGAEIVGLLQSGSAFYAPSAAAVEMVDAILLDQKRVLPCAAHLRGEYGIDDLFVGVPVKLGASGIEEIVELDLREDELADLKGSADSVRELVQVLHG
jgi:malate dehydrogenase